VPRLLLVAQLAAVTLAAGSWWASQNHTLLSSGRWLVGKNGGKFVYETYEFMTQPLSEGYLGLTDHHGFQEILHHQADGPAQRLTRIACQARLRGPAYLWLLLRKQGEQLLACRLSRHPDYPSGFYRYGADGRLIERQPLETTVDLPDGRWLPVELRLADGHWQVLLDGHTLGKVADVPLDQARGGFRGCSEAAQVDIRRVELGFSHPQDGTRSWTIREDFRPNWRQFGWAPLFAVLVVTLRQWRQHLIAAHLPAQRRQAYMLADHLAFLVWLLLPWLPGLPAAVGLALAPLLGEASSMAAALWATRAAPMPPRGGRLSATGAGFAIALALVFGGAALRHGPGIGRDGLAAGGGGTTLHPRAFQFLPGQDAAATDFRLTAPAVLQPGAPLFATPSAFDAQRIQARVRLAPRSTLDVVFQQQSYRTFGDAHGEPLPLRRRLLRLSTREDAASGLATGLKARPAPFRPILGEIYADRPNELEIEARGRDIHVRLNGVETRFAGVHSLGRGETGFLAYEPGIVLEQASVSALRGTGLGTFGWPAAGVLLPLAAMGGMALLARVVAGIRPLGAEVTGVGLAALFPLAWHAAALLLLPREASALFGRERLGALDLALAGSILSGLHLLPLAAGQVRRGALFSNLCLTGLVVTLTLFAWDRVLPPEHPLRLRFTDEALAPGQGETQGGRGPWYARNDLIGANTWMWHQRFGGEVIAPKRPGTVRIFVTGGSQAWGSGAASSANTFSELLERALQAEGLPVEVFNAAVNGAGLVIVGGGHKRLLPQFEPDIVVMDIGTNDSAGMMTLSRSAQQRHRQDLTAFFAALADFWRESGTSLTLVLEPLCAESAQLFRADEELYAALAQTAAGRGMAVVDPRPVTARLERDHSLWWDQAHLTPLGQRLMCELLLPVLRDQVQARLTQPQ
jgi:lysophospholipase L1-like esterase